MAAPEERLLSDGEGGALGSARLSPPPVSEPPEALAPLEPPPQSNTLMGLPIVAIESILSFLSYDETSQLRLVGAGEGRRWGGERGALPRSGPGPAGESLPRRPGCGGPGREQRCGRWGGAPRRAAAVAGEGAAGMGLSPFAQPPPSVDCGVEVCASVHTFLKVLSSPRSAHPLRNDRAAKCSFLLGTAAPGGTSLLCPYIQLKPTSVGHAEPAAPRTLPYLETNGGQKKTRRLKKSLCLPEKLLSFSSHSSRSNEDIASSPELYTAKQKPNQKHTCQCGDRWLSISKCFQKKPAL